MVSCFSIEFIHVTHSIVNAVALAIETPVGGKNRCPCLVPLIQVTDTFRTTVAIIL